ncbi:MAG: hypothetical protein ABI120_23635 [Gemmatimonadaceae bacterium]
MIRSQRGSVTSAALIALLFLGGVALALTVGRKPTGSSVDTVRANAVGPDAETALGVSTVRTADGHVVPLLTKGEPAIIMISSEICEWCKQTFADLQAMSAGRPLPRLKVLTLEGAAEGAPMINRAKLIGLQLIGPVDGPAMVSLTFRFQGTPTFFAIDKSGRVARTLPGYQTRDVLAQLYKVMVGEADVP